MGTRRLAKFTLGLAYVLALLLAVVTSGVLGLPSQFLEPSTLLTVRVAAAFVLLVVAVIAEFASGHPRHTVDWHAGLAFGVLFLMSWLAFIDVTGDGFRQPTYPSGPYTIFANLFGRTHYLTPVQAEIEGVTRWLMMIGLLGRLVTEYRQRSRTRKQA